MSFQTKKGSFAMPLTGTTVPVTGVGFTPKAVIFWATRQTATGFANGSDLSVGFATSASQRYCATVTMLDATAAATATAVHRQDSNLCLVTQMTAGGTSQVTLDLTSLDADGFTVTSAIPAGTPVAVIVHYLALGGSDLANAYVGNAAPSSGTGAKTITGVGFQPDCVLVIDTTLTTIGSAFSNGNLALAAFTGSGARSAEIRTRDSVNPTQTLQYQVNKAVATYSNAADTVDHEATLTTMDSDGFTLNYTTRASANAFGFLALKGGNYHVGVQTQKTSTGTKATTGVGFLPTGLLLFGCSATANASVDLTQGHLALGATDGSAQGCSFISATDNVATSETRMVTLTTKTIRHATNPATTDAEAAITSFDADGYTLDWTTADATAREFVAVSFGSTVVASSAGTMMMMGV